MDDKQMISELQKDLQQHKDWLAQLERQTGVLIPRGQMLSKTDYPALYASLDGYGETKDSFKLPDLSGEYYMIPAVAVSKARLSQVSTDAAKAFSKGRIAFEYADSAYQIIMKFSNREDAHTASGAIGKLIESLDQHKVTP